MSRSNCTTIQHYRRTIQFGRWLGGLLLPRAADRRDREHADERWRHDQRNDRCDRRIRCVHVCRERSNATALRFADEQRQLQLVAGGTCRNACEREIVQRIGLVRLQQSHLQCSSRGLRVVCGIVRRCDGRLFVPPDRRVNRNCVDAGPTRAHAHW